MEHSHPTKSSKENHLQNSIDLAAQSKTPKELEDKKARKTHGPSKSYIMSSLTTAVAANANPLGDRYDDESQEVATPSNSPASKGSNQMNTEENEELGTNLCRNRRTKKSPAMERSPLALATPSSSPHYFQ